MSEHPCSSRQWSMGMLKTAVALQVMQDVCPTGGNYMPVSSYSVTLSTILLVSRTWMSPYPQVRITTSSVWMASLPKDTLKAFCLNNKAVSAVLQLWFWFCAEWFHCWKDANHKWQCPNLILLEAMLYTLFYPLFRLVFGTLYPAYASYKAVRTKNVKEYVSRASVATFLHTLLEHS